MIDNYSGRQARKEIIKLGQFRRLEIDHNMPAQRFYSVGNFDKRVGWQRVDQAFNEIKTARRARRLH